MPFQKFSNIYDHNSIVKIAKNIYITNVPFLYNLGENRDYKYVTILPIVLMLLIKIIVFNIVDGLVIEGTRKSNSLNLSFFISTTMYVIFR